MDAIGSPSQSPARPKRDRTRPETRPRDTPAPAIERLGRYAVTGQLGRGGMGIVYEAEDTLLQRRVAVKLLPREVSSNPESLARFLREARAAAQLNHGHVVAVYDLGESAGTHFIVLELMSGGNAQEILRDRGPFPWREATAILRDVCRGVAAAHAAGLIHRDIKPANILRSADGIVKLGDFGLVKPAGITGTGLTGLGEVVGTPHYMSPEQSRGDTLDERSDLYSLGATYFALLTGRPPFDSPDGMQVLFAHCAQPVPDPCALVPGLPEECAAIVRKAMDKSRIGRYRSAGEMLAALEGVLASEVTNEAGGVDPSPIWSPAKPMPPVSVSLAAAYPAERLRSGLRGKYRWILRGAALLIATAFLAVFIDSRRKPVGLPPIAETISQKDDWPKLAADFEQAIRSRHAGAMRSALERVEVALNRAPPDAKAEREAMRLAKTRLEKAAAFRESISEKGLVIGVEGPVTSAIFSPNGDALAIGQSSGASGALLLDSYTGEKRAALWPSKGGGAVRVQALAFDPAGTTLAAACTTNTIRLSNSTTGRESSIDLGTRVNFATAVAFSPTSRNLAAGFEPFGDGKGKPYLKVWNLDTNREPFAVKAEHSATVSAVAFTAGGHQIATGSHDKRVVLWNAETGRIWRELHTGLTIRAVACSPSGRMLAVAGIDAEGSVVQIWDYAAEKLLISQRSPHGVCACVAFSRDGALLAGGSGSRVLLWNPETDELAATLTGHGRDVSSVAFSAEGGILVSGSADQTVRLWDVTRLRPRGP